MVSPHEVLQIDPGADDAEIEAAYRERVKETHPDQGGSTSEFRLVRLAYEELRAERAGAASAVAADRTDRPARAGAGRRTPHTTTSHVEFLDYGVIEERGWSLEDPDLFEKAAAADLAPPEYGQLAVDPGEYLLEAAEDDGYGWPFSCRGGACANCAVAVCEGDVEMAVDTVLTDDQLDRGIRLSCIGAPVTDRLRVVFDVQGLPGLEELQLPTRSFASDD